MGVFMRLGSPKGVEARAQGGEHVRDRSAGGKHKQGCCSVLDAADARRVAGLLDIPFYVLNFQDDFGRVIDYFVGEYNRGRTPNPCVRCNDWLKFGKLAQYAEGGRRGLRRQRALRTASAPTRPPAGGAPARAAIIARTRATSCSACRREALEHTLLPIGGYREARGAGDRRGTEAAGLQQARLAGDLLRPEPGLRRPGPAADAGDIPRGRVRHARTARSSGAHEGHQHFTIGQRKGVGVALAAPALRPRHRPRGQPRARSATGTTLLRTRRWSLGRSTCLRIAAPRRAGRSRAPPRSATTTPQPATATVTGDDELTVRFDEPQSAVTPGQAVVLYDGDVVLGGGWIDAVG